MNVREAEKNDLSGILCLYTQLHNNTIPNKGGKLGKLWEKIFDNDDYHLVVAEKDGRIISSCTICIIPNLTHEQRPYGLIENVIASDEFENKGAASACLDYAKKIALRENCYKILLMTGSKEESVLEFYRNAGYNSEDKTGFIQWI